MVLGIIMYLFPSSAVISVFLCFISSNKCQGKQYASKSTRRCIHDLSIIWSRELSSAPFAASPLIADIDADGDLDIVSASYAGDIHAIHGRNGRDMEEGQWSTKIPHSTVLSSPLQFDINGDGILDTVIITDGGQIFFLYKDGNVIEDTTFQSDLTSYIQVDPHVLATPVIVDLNQDGSIEEMVIPVSYFFDQREYELPDKELPLGLDFDSLNNYLASSLVVLNLTSLQPIKALHMELTKVTAEFPGYILFTPTLADIDSSFSSLEIVVGTSAGQIHCIDSDTGKNRDGFPIQTDTIFGQLVVEDVNQDGSLEIIAQDVSGNVVCYSSSGKVIWEMQIEMTRPTGTRVVDINADGLLEVMLCADDGNVYVLSGSSGEAVEKWPFKVVDGTQAPPLVMPILPQNVLAFVTLGNNGYLNVISGDRSTCRDTVNLAETSLVQILSHDLVPQAPGLEMLIATEDGTLLCVGSGSNYTTQHSRLDSADMIAWPSENRALTDGTYHGQKFGLLLKAEPTQVLEVSGSSFNLEFEFIDVYSQLRRKGFKLQVYAGVKLLHSERYLTAGLYTIKIPCAREPQLAHLVVQASTANGKVFRSILPVR
ncbi:hypothetical protein CAPTEDRAFT_206740 [Capitella teleta]|uniref:Uncharacterized protein n=1 Tax=Capitella teleta TaxID=283909 RepID=R7TVJ6_CAPTE|nr:hypothetical protein CAPTEDRAFT_206740 [Capitella teleta]|eukprot:ELT95035.1 hypothetical protein CAPTEDRAFT_206740 [Capitella teleta]